MSDVQHDHLVADGTIWHSGPAAPIEPPLPPADRAPDTLHLLGDIAAVRGITRLEPPLDEDWVVVTFALRQGNPWGDKVGEITKLVVGGETIGISAPPDEAIFAAIEAAGRDGGEPIAVTDPLVVDLSAQPPSAPKSRKVADERLQDVAAQSGNILQPEPAPDAPQSAPE